MKKGSKLALFLGVVAAVAAVVAALSALPQTAYWDALGSHFLWAFLAFLAGIPLDILAAGVCWKKACQ